MAQARYTLACPTQDNLGNPLKSVATAAHRWLFDSSLRIQGSYIEPGKLGNWRDDPQEVMDHLVVIADDTPELDSALKALASDIADVANQWGVFVVKEGKSGIQSWVINNQAYRQGEPARPEALADPQAAQQPVQPNNVVQFPTTASVGSQEAHRGAAVSYLGETLARRRIGS